MSSWDLNIYFSFFQTLDKVIMVAYKLNLPSSTQIHTTVHVSQLKTFKGKILNARCIPNWLQGSEGTNVEDQPKPKKTLAKRMLKRHHHVVV